ncbi:MAG: DUF1461 domain-containing protein [Lachnospiraceae bacterium]|nr:DUF1461 domain-containing protein [Lachnospiraceae bacterium]
MKRVEYGIAFIIMMMMQGILVFLCVDFLLVRAPFMDRICREHQVAEHFQTESTEMEKVTKDLIDYVQGRKEVLDTRIRLNGMEEPFYNEKEIQHVWDVRALIAGWKIFSVIGVLLLAALAVYCFGKKRPEVLCQSYLASWLVWILIAAAVGIWAAKDLYGFVNGFHYVFFRNDLWIMDPAVDRIIWLFPLEIFSESLKIAGGTYIAIQLVLTAASILFLRRRKKSKA